MINDQIVFKNGEEIEERLLHLVLKIVVLFSSCGAAYV